MKYMEAAFDREAQSGEFFIEFQSYIQDTKLVERFVELGAGEVCTITFGKDKGISAMDALRRVLLSQSKTGIKFTCGSCSKQLQDRLEDKESDEKDVDKEFDEKTAAAIRFSLKSLGEDMQGIQAQVVKLEEIEKKIENGVQSQAADVVDIKEGVKSQAEELINIKNGVCIVIPDYQRENAVLKEAIIKKTAACDSIEGKLAHKTAIVNRQTAFIAKLQTDMQVMELERQAWLREKEDLLRKNLALKEQLDLTGLLKQMMEKTQYTTNVLTTTIDALASTLEEERANKRARV